MGYKKIIEEEKINEHFNLGERLKAFRMSKCVSQAELAQMMGVYQKDISRWETNFYTPSVFLIKKYCEILQVSADVLLDIKLQ